MTLRIATVLSAREWESRLVAAARSSATVRLVLRAFRPEEVTERRTDLDVVVVGSETPWASRARLTAWVRSGLRVAGIHPAGDRPAWRRLHEAGVDVVLADDTPVEAMLRELRMLDPPAERESAPQGDLIAVTGARGAPGRTEVALGLAWLAADSQATTLVDADLDAPAVAIRLGIDPLPDLAAAIEMVHAKGHAPVECTTELGRLRILPGSHRRGESPLREEPVHDVIDSLRTVGAVVADVGPWPSCLETIKAATTAVVVADASPLGIVRMAGAMAEWAGPPPLLILNRVGTDAEDVAEAARRWSGLDPAALVPLHRDVPRAQRSGGNPSRVVLRHLSGVG